MNKERFFVTTPIYYVNDRPHIGHAYTTILADVLARFNRLCEIETFFLTGTDEHGQKVEQSARKRNLPPQKQADENMLRFKQVWDKLHITYDRFIRTTETRHKQAVQNILQKLYDQNLIYKAEYDGWYCISCERFFTGKDLKDNKCPECQRELDHIREANYFFKMSSYQEWLINYIKEHPDFIQPYFRRNETLGFLKKPLNDLCISRPKKRLSWGIELPFDKDYVTYVWFDALINYISAPGFLSNQDNFSKWWPASCHLIGKDILTTHTVYWPTMLKAMGLPMPECIFAHGWWLSGKSKMSKSRGNVINPLDLADEYGIDAFRYFLIAEMSLGLDCNYSENTFIRKYNADLANDLGNVLSRITKLLATYNNNQIPNPGEPQNEETALQKQALETVENIKEKVLSKKVDLDLSSINKLLSAINRYLEKRQPWNLAKSKNKTPFYTVMYYSAETLRIAAGLLQPVMPEKIKELQISLGLPEKPQTIKDLSAWGILKPGQPIGKQTALFPRITKKKINTQPEKQQTNKDDNMTIEYSEFKRIDLKTARIIEAEKIEGTDKLLKLQIQIGEEQRQIVAGIAGFYTPEQLIGKTIVVVANMKPATIRGVESNGMLLAAADKENLQLITVDGAASSGSTVQ
jgi:methionyl-tRNA synthetase